ncbi:MFS transporter [Paenibacillus eucommiae]|uniref:EmrB/QacA subfamily drug resistance transporter n=1 Tax=Paenibacillus eucommiae TaxID=1355755 RepID=A0ABS4IRU3_9BACL|nr:MFS transporter [Paenibacillus eucommiae]MBP1990260.1 EmrB/QacA subfamily drug resistance transporter [Paenibacillus eucommiae]
MTQQVLSHKQTKETTAVLKENTESSTPLAARNRWLILATVTLGTFMATLDGSIANVALPTISSELNKPIHVVQWVLTAYLLTICATLPILGKISDMIGRSRMYNWGMFIFMLGSALCGLSHSLGFLIASRIIQAVGASCLMSNSQAIVAGIFAKGDRGKAMGIVGTAVSLGALTGPGIGGILVGSLGWPSIFWINVPIGILGFIAAWFLLPKDSVKGKHEPFDYGGSALFILGTVALLYILSTGQDWGWTSPAVLLGLIGACAVLAGFYYWEHKTPYPMLDFSLYKIRAFAIGNTTSLLSFTALFCMTVMMPFYLQNVLLFSPAKTGYTMMIYPLAMAVVAPLSGWLSDKIGPNLLTTAGLLINAAGFALLTTLTAQESAWTVALHLSLFGLGSGLFQSPNNSSVMGAVPMAKLGTAGGLNALVRNIGMIMGISLSVSLFSFRLGQTGGSLDITNAAADKLLVISALHVVFWMGMAFCLLALLVSVRRIGKPDQDRMGG